MIFILLLFTHMKMKKMLLGAFLWIFTLAWVAVLPNLTNAQTSSTPITITTTTDWNNPDGGNKITDKSQAGSNLLTTIKETIKWILGILATIAVCICLYAGFIMMTSAGDEKKYENGMKILKYAAIGLVIIWLSWLIVSAIFWFVKLQGGAASELKWAQWV